MGKRAKVYGWLGKHRASTTRLGVAVAGSERVSERWHVMSMASVGWLLLGGRSCVKVQEWQGRYNASAARLGENI